jgi:hypothetical protein
MLRKNINSDSEVLKWLEPYKELKVVTITELSTNGLEIDVASKAFHKNPNDYSRIKNYLRTNGFNTWCGIATRHAVPKPIRDTEFTVNKTVPNQLTSIMWQAIEDNK